MYVYLNQVVNLQFENFITLLKEIIVEKQYSLIFARNLSKTINDM